MALEFVGGALLSVFLQVAFQKLASPQILDFFRENKLDQKLLTKLETKLNSINSLADDAERKQFTDPHVKDVVLDAEDLLDDIQMLSESQVDAESESQGCSCKEIEYRMEQTLDGLEFLSSQKGDLGLEIVSRVAYGLSNKLPQKSQTTSLVVGTDIYGRDHDKEVILDWLTSDINRNQPSILSIVGMGGVEEFDVFKVSRAIIEGVTKSTDDSRDMEMVHRRLKEKLMGKKFLLVLDDVWNENQPKWEEVKKPLVFAAQGSRILVTIRSKEVASIMREIGMKIVKKCKGLPLALKTMGSLLYNKSSVSEWETLFQSEIWEFSKEHCDIMPALALSYIHLPSHLKICFSYCALFPKDYEFKKEHLIQLWMTENLLHCRQHSKTPEEVCQQYFNDLLSRSFFQQSDEKLEAFVMHDLLSDLAKYVGGDIYFRWDVDQAEKIQKVTRHFSVELGDNKSFDGFGTLCNTKRLRTFMPTSRRVNDLGDRWHCYLSIRELLTKFKFLRILSLSRCFYLRELPDSINNLEHLRSLDLSCTDIRKLYEKICSLSHLQILKLNHCNFLEELPSNLHLLTTLCRLEFIFTGVRKLPSGLEKLKNLKVMMSRFFVDHNMESGIQLLGKLNNLYHDLGIWGLQDIENPEDALEADLKNKTHLVNLKLGWKRTRNSIDSKKIEDVLENLQPSKNLKVLSIFNYGGNKFPKWLVDDSLPNLVFLELGNCESCQHLPPLGLFPLLKKLKIIDSPRLVGSLKGAFGDSSSLESLEISELDAECFPYENLLPLSLAKLTIYGFPNLEKLDYKGISQLSSLQSLAVIHCPKLQCLPEQGLPQSISNLRIFCCPLVEQRCKEGGEDWEKIAHIQCLDMDY
ncbi:hypothetical protein V8G54_023797 [Vigna mungo]|uniref:NB-ARC domain-containing protein n=1 Tax=Vigna mungo TaxID=3915 RepID=A0AAQ3N613_VIGMU